MFITIASVLLALFFVVLGRPESIIGILGESWFYLDLFFVTIICFLVVLYIAVASYTLDEKIPLREHLSKRLLWQSLVGLLVPSLLSLVLTFVYMEIILDQRMMDTTFFIYEFPISIVIILTINLFFVVITLLKNEKQVVKESRSTLIVTQAGKTFPIVVTNIATIAKEGNYTLITTFDEQKFVSNETLDDLITTLPTPVFFRANRQWIINRLVCGPFTTERSGKVNLTLKEPFEVEISVSQKKGQEFKLWLSK